MREVKLTTAQIREVFERTMDGEFPFDARQQAGLAGSVARWRQTEGRMVEWQGASGTQMLGYLRDGYYPEGDAPDLTFGATEVHNAMVELVEEDGDLIVEAALGGEDLMYAQWQDEPAKRGLTVRFNASFNCGTKAKVLTSYYAWVLRIVDAAAQRGIAPNVEIFYDVRGLFGDRNETIRIIIPVVESGQLMDVTAWRAFIHGASFRTLGFAALGLAGDALGKGCRSGLGYSVGAKWDAEFDGETLTILSPGSASDFPEDLMDSKVDDALAVAA